MCTPLDAFVRASFIAPKVWDKVCARQGAWYRNSDRFGQDLLVLDEPYEPLASRTNTIIRISDFRPDRFATPEEMRALIESPVYKRFRPDQWEQVSPKEKKRWERWMSKYGFDTPFDELFTAHSANHANFLTPKLYLGENGIKVPYSIAPSSHLCSCCAEFYNLIGTEYPKKLVSPCLGAIVFAGLPMDRYFEVIAPGASGSV